ncbi:WbqC family protein [Bacillus luteolus]|uniref:WbqC family protein n=1 Tax=Litchfieldia luteola TaxID=682179 RepID=A0ABR9QF82_9BACI|nr:WbqC family protein [Cytobacillus luteolus]MBE4907140.1 WbqC family protein [Cytobacillus luteolus]MBP1943390.1 hypothetical protein [Cytobacillus luteolus]
MYHIKKVAIHQPNYLPWIGFFDKMDQADAFILLDTAVHSKSEFVNRNRIKTPQGNLWLTVPIKQKEIPIFQIDVDLNKRWNQKHWKTIQSNYKKSKYWSLYQEGFEKIYSHNWSKLVDLNLALIMHIKDILGIETDIFIESDFNKDFGKGNTRNINLVKHVNGDIYLSGTGAKAYNDEAEYKENNLTLQYQEFNHPVYQQNWGDFIANLSVIDMIFHCGPDTIHIIRSLRK